MSPFRRSCRSGSSRTGCHSRNAWAAVHSTTNGTIRQPIFFVRGQSHTYPPPRNRVRKREKKNKQRESEFQFSWTKIELLRLLWLWWYSALCNRRRTHSTIDHTCLSLSISTITFHPAGPTLRLSLYTDPNRHKLATLYQPNNNNNNPSSQSYIHTRVAIDQKGNICQRPASGWWRTIINAGVVKNFNRIIPFFRWR